MGWLSSVVLFQFAVLNSGLLLNRGPVRQAVAELLFRIQNRSRKQTADFGRKQQFGEIVFLLKLRESSQRPEHNNYKRGDICLHRNDQLCNLQQTKQCLKFLNSSNE